jgi:uncharacterized membrane protein YdfJ with MMPL/SSD domain
MITDGLGPPDAESERATALLESHFGHQPGDRDAAAVYTDPTGELTVDEPAFQQAVAAATLSVVIDATVVRSIIVPAAMQLLGRANWWPGRPRTSSQYLSLSNASPPASRTEATPEPLSQL